MANAEKYVHTPIEIDSLIKAEQKAQRESDTASTDERQMRAHMITMSKQIERLMTTTDRLLKRPAERRHFPWAVFSSLTGVVVFFCIATIVITHHKQSRLEETLRQSAEERLSRIETMVQGKVASMESTVEHVVDQFESQRKYVFNRLNEVEEQLKTQRLVSEEHVQRWGRQETLLDRLDTNLSQLRSQINDLQKQVVLQDQKITNQLMDVSRVKEPVVATPAPRQMVASLLDKYERQIQQRTQAAPATEPAPDQSSYAKAYAKLAWSYAQKGEFAKAIAEYERAIQMNPGLGMAYYNLACIYAKQGNRQKAMEWLKQGRPYFSGEIVETSRYDADLKSLRTDAYFQLLMYGA